MKSFLPFALVLSLACPADAQEWVFGTGFADFSSASAKDTAILLAEYQSFSFGRTNRLEIGWAGAVSVFATGDIHVGAGLIGRADLGQRWFAEASVLPGLYAHRRPGNDLGSAFEIRSLVSVGRWLKNGSAISVALTHKSNGTTAARNPGVNALMLRWHVPITR